jgi:hypothetical protein
LECCGGAARYGGSEENQVMREASRCHGQFLNIRLNKSKFDGLVVYKKRTIVAMNTRKTA